jgi:hypothetical protein
VDEVLRGASSRGREAPLVFVDAREMPSAYAIAGRYVRKDGRTTVAAALFRGDAEVATFTVEGDEADVPGLARRVVEEARARISR